MGVHVGKKRNGRWPVILYDARHYEVIATYTNEATAKTEQDRIRRLSTEAILAIKYGKQFGFTTQ
jgi:hypothetical protein